MFNVDVNGLHSPRRRRRRIKRKLFLIQMSVEVFAYSTPRYKRLAETWKRSIPFQKWTLVEGPEPNSYVECIESKIKALIDFEPSSDFVIVSDVDVVFFASEKWIEVRGKGVLFMRDAVKTNLNAGFFVVEKGYLCEKLKPFLKKMLSEEEKWKTMKHYEQSYMNEHLPRDEWDFIPDEYVYMPFVEKNMARVLFYHAICVPEKERALDLAMKTKKYQVHLCFHAGVEEPAQSVLYRHPYMIPYRLRSTKYYESEFFMNLDEIDPRAEYVGMVTYSILYKPCFKTNILRVLEGATEDIVAFHVLNEERIENTNRHHPKFLDIWNRLMDTLGVSREKRFPPRLFFCNYWVAKPHVLKEYQEFIKRATEFLEEDPDVYADACYKEAKLSPERLVEIGGKPHYTYHPFILERLPCLFAHVNSYSVRYS